MCAVCWSAGQIIPASAAAWRYAQVNRHQMSARWTRRRGTAPTSVAATALVPAETHDQLDGCACGTAHEQHHEHHHEPHHEPHHEHELDPSREPVPVGG